MDLIIYTLELESKKVNMTFFDYEGFKIQQKINEILNIIHKVEKDLTVNYKYILFENLKSKRFFTFKDLIFDENPTKFEYGYMDLYKSVTNNGEDFEKVEFLNKCFSFEIKDNPKLTEEHLKNNWNNLFGGFQKLN